MTKERINLAKIAIAQHGDRIPLQHLFEDISNPEKICLLKEFMDHMKNIGSNIDNCSVMVAKEGEIYKGIYRSAGPNSFVFSVKDTYIIGNKEHLPPKQLRTLKPSDKIIFTVPQAKDLDNILIPKEILSPLTKNETAKLIAEDACVHLCRKQIEHLSKIVYGSVKTLNKQMVEIIKNPEFGQRLANQIERTPYSLSSLAGISLCGLQNQTRANAKNHIDLLCNAIVNFAHAATLAKKEIIQEHQTEQKRRKQPVEMPSQDLQNLLSFPREKQKEILIHFPILQQKLDNFVRKLNKRLSQDEYQAIKNNDHMKLAESIGTSKNKAKMITEIVTKTQKVFQQSQMIKVKHSKLLTIAS